MPKNLFLIGGGPGAVLAMRRHFKAALAAVGKPRPVVAYVGAAMGDSPRFQKMITTFLGPIAARFRPVKLAARTAKVSEARGVLEDSDMIFVSGGDVDAGMSVLHDRGVVPLFRELAEAKPFVGMSAGSLMLGREWVRFREGKREDRAEIFPCIGAAPLHVDAHSEEDDWSELRTLVGLLHARGDADPVGYGLSKKGCLHVRVENGGNGPKRVDLAAMGAEIPRLVVRRGKVVHAAPLAPKTSR